MSYGSGVWFHVVELVLNSVPKVPTAPELSSKTVELVQETVKISSGADFSSILEVELGTDFSYISLATVSRN